MVLSEPLPPMKALKSTPDSHSDTSDILSKVRLTTGWTRHEMTLGDGRRVSALLGQENGESIVIPLPQSDAGPVRLRIGMLNFGELPVTAMQVRIGSSSAHTSTKGTGWRRVRPMHFLHDGERAEIQFVDLDMEPASESAVLEIRPDVNARAAVAEIRLVPVGAESPKANRHAGHAAVVFDGPELLGGTRIDSPGAFYDLLAPYKDSDINRIFWGTTVGTYRPLHFSQTPLGWHGQEDSALSPTRLRCAKVMRMFHRAGIDPLTHVIRVSHDLGLELWANIRINHNPNLVADYPGGRFLCAHLDKRVLERDSSPHAQGAMSFAYPEIREMSLRLMVEQAGYPDIDGLYIDFTRKCPIIGFEPIVRDQFSQRYGIDLSGPTDTWFKPWMEHQCSYVTSFLRELRAAVNEIAQRRGRAIPIAVQVPGGWRFSNSMFNCQVNALDPVTWAREGLIDILAPSEWTSLMHEHQSLDRFVMATRGTSTQLWGVIGAYFREAYPSRKEACTADLDPWLIMRDAHDFYQQGTAGVVLWEGHELTSVPQRWEVIRNIGDREMLKKVFSPLVGRFDGSHRITRQHIEMSEPAGGEA